MKDLKGKKLLIVGGSYQHCKVVEAAKRLGVITYVTDYLPVEKSPAKQISDHYYMYNITDIDKIVNACKKEGIDGAIALSLDPCQRPYQKICEKAGFPCFGSEEQYLKLTNKNLFKQCCIENRIDIIPEYEETDFIDQGECSKKVEFPVFIKPCDSRGSRGQSICYNFEDAIKGINTAKEESSNGNIVIEKYMGNCVDFTMSYIVINGEPILTRTADRYPGLADYGLNRVCMFCYSPSNRMGKYMKDIDAKICAMIKSIGLKNAPVFMQGFWDGDKLRVYDPGLRYPGSEYERMYEIINGITPIDALIEFALTGSISENYKNLKGKAALNGQIAACVLPTVFPGTIKEIYGLDEINKHPNIVYSFCKYTVGDVIEQDCNVNRRLAEFDVIYNNFQELIPVVDWIYEKLIVLDSNNNNMLVPPINLDFLLKE